MSKEKSLIFSLHTISILIFPIHCGVHGRIYREYEKFEENSTKEFGIANFDFMLIGTDDTIDENSSKMPESLVGRFGFVFAGLVNTDSQLDRVLKYFPVGAKIMLEARSKDVSWIKNSLITRNASHRIHTIWISYEYAQVDESTIKQTESLGINVGIQCGVKLKNTEDINGIVVDFDLNPSIDFSKLILVMYIIHTQIYDFDIFSRQMDKVYNKIAEETINFQPKIFLAITVDTSIMRENYKDSELYQQLSARYLYTWGARAKVPVMFESWNPFFLEQFHTFDQHLYHPGCCESASIDISELSLGSELSNMRSRLLCLDFSDLIILVNIRHYDANLTGGIFNLMEQHCKPSLSFFISLAYPNQREISLLLNFIKEVAYATYEYSGKFNGVFVVLNATNCRPYNSLLDGIKSEGLFPLEKIFIYGSTCGDNADNFRKPIMIRLMNPGYRSIARIELIGNVLSNGHEETQKYLSDRVQKVTPFTYQHFLFKRDALYMDKGCYGFKIFWNSLRQWAALFRYRLVSQLTLSITEDVAEIDWFKKMWPTFSFNSSGSQTAKFISNYKDECVILDVPPKKYFNWTARSLSGVTLNIGENPLMSINAEELASLLKLVHSKFARVELFSPNALQLTDTWKIIRDAIISYGKLNKTHVGNYYINVGKVDQNQYKKFVEMMVPIFKANSKIIKGIHFEFSSENETQKHFTDIKSLSRTLVSKVGIIINYRCKEEWITPNQLVLIHANYVVLNLRVAGLVVSYLPGTPHTPALEHFKNFQLDIFHDKYDTNATCWVDFDHVFIQIRLLKLKYLEVNPDLEIILKVQIATERINNRGVGLMTAEKFLSISKFLDEFSSTFQFPILFDNAFDSYDNGLIGWWRAKDARKLGDPNNYAEKISEFYSPLEKEKINFYPRDFTNYKSTDSGFSSVFSIVVIAFITALLILATIGIASLVFYLKRKANLKREKEVKELLNRTYYELGSNGFPVEYNEHYELHKDDFNASRCSIIGAGKFGIVYKTYMSRFGMEVAVKVPQTSQFKSESDSALKSMIWEIRIMSYVGKHTHILKLLGAYTKDVGNGNIFLVTELCEHGSLLDHLKDLNEMKENDDFVYELYRFCEEISSGMEYLAEKNVIHGDLSARNVLLGTHKVCKISDFGLSRKLDHYEKYIKESSGPLPWAWMAIESLQRLEFTLKSDVWSMGVTFWEIFTFGRQPYAGLCLTENFKNMLADGMRLEKPENVHEQIYDEMMSCWSDEPNSRPSPTHFVQYFRSRRTFGYENIEEVDDVADTLMESKV